MSQGNTRRAISKRIRFEVLKRDKFTCQYCGKSAPDVVLEVDHIKPVSKGGTNDIMNLITSCKECNRGKSNIEISDDSVVKKQQAQMQELAERKEQLEMMLEWRESLKNLDEEYATAIADALTVDTPWVISDSGMRNIKKWLKQFTLTELLDAVEIAMDTYYIDGDSESWNEAFNKVTGICYIKRNQKDNPQIYYVNYTLKALKNKDFYVNKGQTKSFILNYVLTNDDFELLKAVIKKSRNWTDFKERCEVNFDGSF